MGSRATWIGSDEPDDDMVKPPPDIRARLVRVGALAEGRIDPAETALVLASVERPGVSMEPYRRHLERLAVEAAAFADSADGPGGLGLRVETLARVIARRYGYGGAEDAYDDPDSTNLMRVIDRRRGLPVALGIIYIHVARALGWPICGIDFPARFLVRLEDDGNRVILDPFDGGRLLSAKDMRDLYKAVAGNHAELTPAHYRALENRDVLVRLQNNIKVRLLRAENLEEAVETVETMLLFAPGRAALWREAGLLHARLDNVPAAVAALEEYLRHSTGDPARYRTSVFLQELRGRLS